MNSTPQEKLILRKFYKHLDPSMFWVYVKHVSWSKQLKFYIGVYPSISRMDQEPLFTGYYSSQQEALDMAEGVCMMVVFGVQGA